MKQKTAVISFLIIILIFIVFFLAQCSPASAKIPNNKELFENKQVTAVPEPATYGLFAAISLVILVIYKQKFRAP